jgi:uncharacterized protein
MNLYVTFPVSGVSTWVFLPPVVAFVVSFLTSIAGVVFYSIIPVKSGISTAPDWGLGILFGLGGLIGMYCGARVQKYVPPIIIKAIMGIMLLFLASTYIIQYFTG